MANRAWLYCRIGGETQGRRPPFGMQHEEQELLDNQEQRLLDYCAQQGLQVAGVTRTIGSSKGELEKLSVQGIEQNDFDFLVTISAAKLSHDVRHLLIHAQKLADNGIGICMVNEDICTLPIQGPEQNSNMEMGGLAQ